MALHDYQQSYAEIARSLGKTSSPILVDVLIKLLRIEHQNVVVDIGGGTGGDAELLATATGARVIVLDRSYEMLQVAPEMLWRVQADALVIPLHSATVDAVYMVNVLQLVRNWTLLLSEIRRILRSGARLGLPVTSRAQLQNRFINRFFPALLTIERERYPSISQLITRLQSVGFSKIQTQQVDIGSFIVNAAYVERLRSGIFSGLGFLNDSQREEGFRKLQEWIEERASVSDPLVVRRVRTVVTAEVQ